MGVHVLRNFPPLAGLPLTSREVMREVGLLARQRIYERTTGGQDMHGQAFKPYSQSYQTAKARELGSTGVNLQVSGAMLNALTIIEVTDHSVTLGFR